MEFSYVWTVFLVDGFYLCDAICPWLASPAKREARSFVKMLVFTLLAQELWTTFKGSGPWWQKELADGPITRAAQLDG